MERLASRHGWEVRLYAQSVRDVKDCEQDSGASASGAGTVRWRRIWELSGPHLFKYIAWFFAVDSALRADARDAARQCDVVYSPGINSRQADAIVVHAVFHELHRQVRNEMRLTRLPLRNWPVVVHRRVYYRLIMALESRIYRDERVRLAAVSNSLAEQLKKYFGRTDVTVIPNAVDTCRFSAHTRSERRTAAREQLGVSEDELAVLLIGNGWKNKGLDTLLGSLAQLRNLKMRLLVVGRDDTSLYKARIVAEGLQDRVAFLPPDSDVMKFYAAADVYAAPSLEDSFNLPVLEAMACGLPTIVSVRAGASDLIRHGENGLLLRDPRDAQELSREIGLLYEDAGLRERLGQAARRTAADCTWERNAQQTDEFLESVARRKSKSA